jgi:alternate signal-mediated exported protein
MKKITKGIIATAAGIVILGGGAGSLAYWSQSVQTGDLLMSTGYLEFSDAESLNKYYLNEVEVTYAELQAHRFVPGDEIRHNQWLRVDTSMPSVLRVPALDTNGTTPELLDEIDINLGWNLINMSLVPTTIDGTYNVVLPGGPGTIDLSLTITWPAESTADGLQLMNLDLPSMDFVLEQVAEPLPAHS